MHDGENNQTYVYITKHGQTYGNVYEIFDKKRPVFEIGRLCVRRPLLFCVPKSCVNFYYASLRPVSVRPASLRIMGPWVLHPCDSKNFASTYVGPTR